MNFFLKFLGSIALLGLMVWFVGCLGFFAVVGSHKDRRLVADEPPNSMPQEQTPAVNPLTQVQFHAAFTSTCGQKMREGSGVSSTLAEGTCDHMLTYCVAQGASNTEALISCMKNSSEEIAAYVKPRLQGQKKNFDQVPSEMPDQTQDQQLTPNSPSQQTAPLESPQPQ